MKERVIILAEGGACGHFICTLLQTMHDPDIFNKLKMPEHGSMDLIAGIGSLTHKFFVQEKGFTIYPERKDAMNLIMDAFNNPETTYKPYQSNYEKQFHEVHVIHYQWQEHIDQFLSLPNTKIIFVTYGLDDFKRIAVNKILKNFAIEAMAQDSESTFWAKKHYTDQLRWGGFDDAAEELSLLDNVGFANNELLKVLVRSWKKYIALRHVWCSPTAHENMLILNFNDLYFNKELVMQTLSGFAGQPINDNTIEIYNNYLAKQPNIDLY
mgnify:CR=1 FL=1|jgi:hypothetical protein